MRLAKSSMTTSSSVGSSSMPKMVSSTISAVQSLPEHKTRFKKLQIHMEICERCSEVLQSQKLVDLIALEQDLVTKGLNVKLEKELLRYLQDPSLSLSLKLRLLMLCEALGEGGPSLRLESVALTGRSVSRLRQWSEVMKKQREVERRRDLRARSRARGWSARVIGDSGCQAVSTGCLDLCGKGPNVKVQVKSDQKVVEGVKTFKAARSGTGWTLLEKHGAKLRKLDLTVAEIKYDARRAKTSEERLAKVEKGFKAIGNDWRQEPHLASSLLALRAEELLAKEDLEAALTDARKACELWAGSGPAHLSVAVALLKLGKTDEAKKAFDLAQDTGTSLNKELSAHECRWKAAAAGRRWWTESSVSRASLSRALRSPAAVPDLHRPNTSGRLSASEVPKRHRRRRRFQLMFTCLANLGRARLWRWRPRVANLLQDAAAGNLDNSQFRCMRSPNGVVGHAPNSSVVVFVLGGITLPEVRAAHEVTAQLPGIQAYVGGNCLLTPSSFLELWESS
eukprot:g27246.t1